LPLDRCGSISTAVLRRSTRSGSTCRGQFDCSPSRGDPGQVLSREQLLRQVWGYASDVETNVVDVFVGYVRRKLDAAGAPRLIDTVRGVGFVLRVE
jgi:two-component system response regulator PrrA